MRNKYIIQNMTKFLDYNHYLKNYNNPTMSYFDDKKSNPNFIELYSLKYVMVVAEPGFGKTRLLKELVLRGSDNNAKVFFIDSKQIKNSIQESIQKCKVVEKNISEEKLQKTVYLSNTDDFTLDKNSIVCLDALDELPFSKLYDFLEQVEEFISNNPDIKLFVSCRTHHLKKVEYDLSKIAFEYINLDSFYEKQVFDYLKDSGLNKVQIEEIEYKSKLGNLYDYLTIPRYLYYFSEIIKNKNIDEIVDLSRSEIFEEFIYRKIDKERDKKYPESENHTIKRVLEELALIMKIFQISQISKDDFFTVFKELNLGNIFTGKGLIEKLSDKSLLKDNIDFLEFENQQFLDFLAAKELGRFEKIEQVFFDMAVEPHFQEVYANWFYVMPFVLEQHPSMINIILDFLEKNSNKVLRDGYFSVITSIDPRLIDKKIKSRIFNVVFDYYYEHNQWLTPNKLIHFYIEDEHYQKIVDSIECDISIYTNRIKVSNCIEIIEELSKYGWLLESQLVFWKSKFLEWLKLDVKDYKYFHRTIISSCSILMKNDFEWMKGIYYIFKNGIEVQHEYSRACNKISPNDKFSIDIYFQCDQQFKNNKIDRATRLDDNVRYISKVNTQEGIQYILEKITSKDGEKDLNYILHESYKDRFQDDIKQFISNIQNNLNDEVLTLSKKLIVNLLIKTETHYGNNRKHLFKELLKAILEKDESFIFELIDEVYQAYLDGKLYYFKIENIIHFDLSKYFNNKNFDEIYKKLKKIDDENEKSNLSNFMGYRFYFSDEIDKNVKNKIEKLYKKEIKEAKENSKKYEDEAIEEERNRQIELCKVWEHKIEPEPKIFQTDLFAFYINNKERLEKCENFEINKNRTIDIAKDIIKFNNPLDGKVTVNGSTASIKGIHFYKKAIKLLHKENEELTDQDLIDNIFRHLPFDINSEYKATLKLASNPSPKAIQDIIDVYSGEKRDDDLDIYHPQNFIKFYKTSKIKEAEPLLLKMLNNSQIEEYIHEQIINILPKKVLTQEIIQKYLEDNGKEDELYEDMLIALVKNFDDKEAIKKIFEIVIKKGVETEISESASSLWSTPLELDRVENKIVHTLINIDYDIEEDKKLLDIAIGLRSQSKDLNASFFEEIVFRHLKHLNHKESFKPLIEIEKFLQENKSKTSLNWFEYKFKELKDVYLKELAKPKHIMEAIKSYKKSKENEYLVVNSALHLLETVKEAIAKEIRYWIEVEGAYKYIEELSKKDQNQNAEDFIQKTLKPQIELALLKKGLRDTDIRIKREEQTMDDKRADFTISYGFVGQILLELKLSSNQEAGGGKKAKEYKTKLNTYIGATNSDYGIFIIFNIKKSKKVFESQIAKLSKLYDKEEKITVVDIDCKN
ncbi:NACHT domain-containing protein [Sulfurimonas lithotrophica]|uniref:NACHT domain-containing protein n=1 Tax=Sulfurimonas lithotrophica TaxID=2590022 RepID=UPI00165EC587|nr:hypothetical protein [Sulfurimonas lithotrophica]